MFDNNIHHQFVIDFFLSSFNDIENQSTNQKGIDMGWIPAAVAALEKMGSSSRLLTRLYSWPYRRVVENEILLARLNKDDVVLNIGCGAIPFTALYLAGLAGCRVFALDLDHNAARLAKICVLKAGLEDMISVFHADGSKKFEQPYTACIVALQAAPKDIILNALIKTSGPGARFIFRMPSPHYRDHYDSLTSENHAQAVAVQPMRTFDRSVLFRQAA